MSEKKLKRHGLHRLHGLGWCKHPRPPWGVTQGDGIIQKMPKVNDSIIQKYQKVNDIARCFQMHLTQMDAYSLKEGFIITEDQDDEMMVGSLKIIIRPLWKWLLGF